MYYGGGGGGGGGLFSRVICCCSRGVTQLRAKREEEGELYGRALACARAYVYGNELGEREEEVLAFLPSIFCVCVVKCAVLWGCVFCRVRENITWRRRQSLKLRALAQLLKLTPPHHPIAPRRARHSPERRRIARPVNRHRRRRRALT